MVRDIVEAALGEVVAIAIGPNETIFQIHKALLCKKSDYFRTAYNGKWKESNERVTLEDVDVGLFSLFVHWLYKEELPLVPAELLSIANADGGGSAEDNAEEYGWALLQACAFANRFLVAEFERIAHNQFVDYLADSSISPRYAQIIFAYGNLKQGSPVLDLMVERQCLWWSPHDDGDEQKQLRLELPKEFLVQVMVKLAEARDVSDALFDPGLPAEFFYM